MLVKEAMSTELVTVEKDYTIFDACNVYKENKVGCLIVIDNDKCVGIVTERDIIEKTICAKLIPEINKISEIMSTDLKTIHALDTVEKAIKILEKNKIKRLPVIMDNEIVGILTVTDISKLQLDLSKRFVDSWIKPKWQD